jgi:hypothetical protein
MLPNNNDKHTPIRDIKERPSDLRSVERPLSQSRRLSSKGFTTNLEVNMEWPLSFYRPPMRLSRDSERLKGEVDRWVL